MFAVPVEAVKAVGDWSLWIRFADGVEGEADISRLSIFCGFAGLANRDRLSNVYVHPWSKLITWYTDETIGPCDIRQIYDTLSSDNQNNDGTVQEGGKE